MRTGYLRIKDDIYGPIPQTDRRNGNIDVFGRSDDSGGIIRAEDGYGIREYRHVLGRPTDVAKLLKLAPRQARAIRLSLPGAPATAEMPASPSDASTTPKQKSKPGPKPGQVKRYGADDEALFDRVSHLMAEGRSLTAATELLANEGKVAGKGAPKSRARRLAIAYNEAQNS
jgi:hypothetical protein